VAGFDQVCVVPFRLEEGEPRFCLVTSTGSGDWIFPKGNIDPGATADEAALQEAREEAGLTGRVLGVLTAYSYTKMGRYTLTVQAVLMEVSGVASAWDEDHLRSRRWATADEVRGLLVSENLLEVFRAATAFLGRSDAEDGPGASAAEVAGPAVVILEDDGRRTEAMRSVLAELAPELAPVVFDNAPDMIVWLERHLDHARLISLDNDLGPSRTREGAPFDPGDGRAVVAWLEQRDPVCPVIVHTSNHLAAPGMVLSLKLAGWAHERVPPFSDLEWIDAAWARAVHAALDAGDR
jgi:8-oxo-dGTP pyrophosphatase MutT (NUDIX family)